MAVSSHREAARAAIHQSAVVAFQQSLGVLFQLFDRRDSNVVPFPVSCRHVALDFFEVEASHYSDDLLLFQWCFSFHIFVSLCLTTRCTATAGVPVRSESVGFFMFGLRPTTAVTGGGSAFYVRLLTRF